jgi:hypothetical protein
MSSDATLSDENLPARPVLKDAPTVAGRQKKRRDAGMREHDTVERAAARRVAQARSRRRRL